MKEIENNQWIANYRTDQPHFGLERMVELLALREYVGKARAESWRV